MGCPVPEARQVWIVLELGQSRDGLGTIRLVGRVAVFFRDLLYLPAVLLAELHGSHDHILLVPVEIMPDLSPGWIWEKEYQ